MAYDKFRTQKETKRKNEEAILKSLNEKPKRFTNLKEETGLSQMGLTAILKRLVNEGKIEKIMYSNHEAYQLTKKGQDYVKGMWMILNEIYELQNTKTSYSSNYFSNSDIFWYSLIELKSPYIDYSDFITRVSDEYQNLILQEIKRTYLKKNDDNTYSISEPQKITGKHILAFEVDFDLIRKNVEEALKPETNSKNKIGKNKSKSVSDIIKADKRNYYRSILLGEKRTNILHSGMDNNEADSK